MSETFGLWCWSLAALVAGMLALAQLRRGDAGLPRRAFVAALFTSALWALAVAGIDPRSFAGPVSEAARTIAWLGVMWSLARRDGPARAALASVYGVAILVVLANVALAAVDRGLDEPGVTAIMTSGRLILRMMVAISALVLTRQLYAAVAPGARGGLRLLIGALAAMWTMDLLCYGAAYWFAGWPPGLVAARGLGALLLGPVFAVAAHRGGDWRLSLSRAVTFPSLAGVAVALYVGVMLAVTGLIEAGAGAHARLWQTAFVFGTTTALLTLVANPWLRAWINVKLSKHLFRHRYDYRAEWVRFTDTLGLAGAEEAPLDRRIVKAVADLAGAPAGLLLVPEGAGLGAGAAWNWPDPQAGGEPLARHLAATARIIELDAVRAGAAGSGDTDATPHWMLMREDAWVVTPLLHFGELVGAIVLARPLVDRALDWEDFDLLRIAGRQVASYLAEARALGALAEARRFDEFNRRFAFIVHDIKNLVSQLSLVARNAERHADNPAFRADMIATLRDSADKMNALLARLSQHHGGQTAPLAPVALLPLVERVARAGRALHPIAARGAPALAMADAARLEQLLGHVVQNAVEASTPDAPVTIEVIDAADGPAIVIADRGRGMSPAFVRDELFRPFHSSKPGGFGIGAYEARQLAEAMGGALDVESREGEGTRFVLRLAAAPAMEAAA